MFALNVKKLLYAIRRGDKMKIQLMKCGHKPNATSNGKPCCVICAGIKSGHDEFGEIIDLANRECKCPMCKKIVPSDKHIAFFEFKPTEKYDEHYDGCRGWD